MKIAKRITTTMLAASFFVPAMFAAHVPAPSPGIERKDAQTQAVEHYHDGRARLDRIEKMADGLKTADAKAAARLQKKLEKQLESAAADFKRSVRANPALFQAWSELGFTLRKLGRFDESLEAYDKALAIEPRFGPAIEYRAEAYLGLGRIDEAKEAYTILFSGDRALADQLFEAMKEWASERREDPKGIDAQQLDQLGTWIAQREAIHRQVGALTTGSAMTRSW